MATSLQERRQRKRLIDDASSVRVTDIAYYESQIRAWSRTDDANSRRNVAEFTRRLERAQGRLARLRALLEGGHDG